MPDGRHMPLVRHVALAIRGLDEPADIRDNLIELEKQLVSMGAHHDPELAEGLPWSTAFFSKGARLVEARNLQ